MNGILLVNKDKDFTSQDVVSKIKRIFKIDKVGHAGTLDPLATGVVVVLLGKATKLSNYLLEEDKTYLSEVVIGKATDTEDALGDVLLTKEVASLTEKTVDEVLESIKGEMSQVPPMYSAIKVNGKKLYDLARKGIVVERKPRIVNIHYIRRTSSVNLENNEARFSFETKVSKGTYIRTLCTEIGSRLKYPAHMANLCRVSSGRFKIENSYTLKDIENGNFQVISMVDALENIKKVVVNENEAKQIKNGIPLQARKEFDAEELVAFIYNGDLLAIYKKNRDEYKAERVWN